MADEQIIKLCTVSISMDGKVHFVADPHHALTPTNYVFVAMALLRHLLMGIDKTLLDVEDDIPDIIQAIMESPESFDTSEQIVIGCRAELTR